MEWLQVFGICGILACSGAQTSSPWQSPSFLISAPTVLRPKIPFSASVTVLARSPVRVITEIVNGNTSLVRAETEFLGGSTGLQVLPPIPNSSVHYSSPYELVVKGYVDGSLVFTNSSTLRFDPKSHSTFIQTDKSLYGPGQTVKIRAVSIFPDGKPCKSKVNIALKDPRKNMILQWLDLDSFVGVVSKEFQLSDHPPLGVWTIEASVDELVTEKQFTVDYYELPRFEVQIKAPSVIHHKDRLTGTVFAKYTYGKPVEGSLSVIAEYRIYSTFKRIKKTMKIDGSADFVFYKEDFSDYSMYAGATETIYLTALVTESLTDLKYNKTIEITVFRDKYHLTFREYPRTLKPSLNFATQLKISTYNMEPLSPEDQQQLVTLTVTQNKYSPWSWGRDNEMGPHPPNASDFPLSPAIPELDYPSLGPREDEGPEVLTLTLSVPQSGLVSIHLPLSDDVASLHIDANFRESWASLALYSSYSSPSNAYFQLQRQDSSMQVGFPLQFIAQSNFPLKELHYLVVSRGQVVAAGSTSASFTLTPDESWAPQACVVAYTVLTDGEIVNDAICIPITHELRNNVSLSWSRASVKPGEQVTLGVSVAEPESLVGILVVDKATKLLKQDNDITMEAVLEELAEYNTDKVSSPEMAIMRNDPLSVFKACDLMVLTDAMLPEVEDSQHSPFFPGEVLFAVQGAVQDGVQEAGAVSPGPRVRKEFPETWLWLDTNMSTSTAARIPVTAPDSITSWVATAFVMSENRGLGLTSVIPQLTVFQDFFLHLSLPSSMKRGEELVMDVILFNYQPQDLQVMVIVADSESFEFVLRKNNVSMASTRTVSVASQGTATASFPIRPTVLGEMAISVQAISFMASDALIKKFLIKPEGIQRSFSKTLFLELNPAGTSLSEEVVFMFPPDVVPDSKRAEVSVVGDILGPSISGLESLIKMPYGCGEQNMIHFAPNIYVLQYLNKTRQMTEDIHSKAIFFMLQGYQRQLSYQRQDGSFSAFGDSDPSGSTWLSAFVLRCFQQARPFILIDPGVLKRTVAWLVRQQERDGAFNEPGVVIHTALQGGLDGPVALTSYVLIALLEEPTYKSSYHETVSEALAFLEGKLESGISSNYSLCLAAYALSLASHPRANAALTELLNRADVYDGVMSWSSSSSKLSKSLQPSSLDIEMAAYVLLTLFKQGMLDRSFPLLKWMVVQRNDVGGFGSTQDTIIALQALSWFAAFSSSAAINLNVKAVCASSQREAGFHIDSTNHLLLQSKEIEAGENIRINVSAEGNGFALFQLNVFYNVKNTGSRERRDTAEQEAFDLSVKVTADKGNMDHFIITICTRLLEDQGIEKTGMALMDVGLPSGFVLAQEGVKAGDLIKNVETISGQVFIYLDAVTQSLLCVNVPIMRDFKVAHAQNALISVYDYYEPTRRAEKEYGSEAFQNRDSCSFCGDGCVLCQEQDLGASGSPSSTRSEAYVTVALLLVFLLF
ncbi:hypothetical protein GJAV_G00121140 [Gymnothorax javanicus]|nr:hypothetical protein GJAV_G00121140 [Gymnothorax javanicus]